MKILIHGINYTPELTGIGKYTGEMGEWLASRGHEVRVVTAPPYYPAWKVARGYLSWSYRREHINGVNIWRCPLWVPARPKGLSRIVHLLSFMLSSFPVMFFQVFWRPDVVLTIEPPLFCAPQALLTARLSGARAWLHVQDFEIEAFFGLGFGSSSILRKVLTAGEGWLMRRFDRVSTISRSMQNRLYSFGVHKERATIIPNWVDTSKLKPGIQDRGLRTEWGLVPDQPVLLYSGNIGKKQGLEMVLDAAERLQVSHPNARILIVGEGAAREGLADDAERRKIRNVLFKPLQPLDDLASMLAMADIHLIIQRRGVADAVMPSKLTGILAVGGHSIITANQDTELGRLVADNPGIAALIEPEDPVAFINAVNSMLGRIVRDGRINEVARSYAERFLDQHAILAELEKDLVRASGATAPLLS